MRVQPLFWLLAALLASSAHAADGGDLEQQIDAGVRDCHSSETLTVPMRSSGFDLVPLYGNGYTLDTDSGSPFARRDLSVHMRRQDDLAAQLNSYLRCDSPVLRATQAQLQQAASITEDDSRTRMVVIYQHGWSAGADALVARNRISSLADLSGARIALEANGPQLDLLVSALRTARKQVENNGNSWQQPDLVFTSDQTGFDQSTPGGRFYRNDKIDAALVFRPDADVLTSGGTTGTGAEGSVKGAEILFSTHSASRAVSDVYAVRADYLNANRSQVKRFVAGLFRSEEQVREDVKKLIVDWNAVAKHLLGDASASGAAKTMWRKVNTAGMQGNIDWANADRPRSFRDVNKQIADTLVPLGLLDAYHKIRMAGYDYSALAKGVFDKRRVELPSFDADEAAQMVSKQREKGELNNKTIASFEINFEPNQSQFPASKYRDDFKKIVEAASTYGGAVFTVEGNADPLSYLKKKKKGATLSTLRSIRQAARNLSRSRAVSVRKAVIDFARKQDVAMDKSQFVTEGLGFSQPKTGICGGDPCAPKTKQQWLSNMRVTFRAVRVDAESSTFTPPNSW